MNQMKGIILAGGTATRLFPLTATTSKQLLPVYNRQMIFYPLNTLIKGGVKEILVIISPEHSGQFVNLLGRIFERHEVRLEFKVQSVPRGLAEAFILGENFIDDDNVAMILGDNIFEDDFSDTIKSFRRGGVLFAKEVSDAKRYGIIEFDKDGKVLSIEEKPEHPKSNWAQTGLFIFDNRVVNIAKNLTPSNRGEIEVTHCSAKYLEMGELVVQKLTGEWLDAGTFDTLLEAGRIVKEKEIYKNFDPQIEKAIEEFNAEIKTIAKKQLL
jgi:glucose-1-phosphate thymidylyltransferase